MKITVADGEQDLQALMVFIPRTEPSYMAFPRTVIRQYMQTAGDAFAGCAEQQSTGVGTSHAWDLTELASCVQQGLSGRAYLVAVEGVALGLLGGQVIAPSPISLELEAENASGNRALTGPEVKLFVLPPAPRS